MNSNKKPIKFHYESEICHILNGLRVAQIVECGIKFFIHQRNQLPVPFEDLTKNSNYDDLIGETGACTINDKLDIERPIERLRYLQKQSKQSILRARFLRRQNIQTRKEFQAKTTLDETFEVLQKLIVSCTHVKSQVTQIILLFGPSINTPKEMIIFHIDERLYGLEKDTSTAESPDNINIVPIIRDFYKRLIISDTFMDFTNKRLYPTNTHICIQTANEIDNYDHLSQVFLLENFSSTIHPARRCKTLNLKLALQGHHAKINPLIHHQHDNVLLLGSNSFSSLTTSSSTFYQIPLRFKGFSAARCKNKQRFG